MSPLLCLFALVGVVFCAPALTDRQQKLVKVFGEDTNVTRAEAVIEEEARKLGISADEYYNACTANADAVDFTDEEEADMKREGEALAKMKGQFNNRDEVLKALQQNAPKTYAVIMKRVNIVEKELPKLDGEAQNYVRKLGNFLLDGVVALSKAENDFFGQLSVIGKATEQILADYKSLPQSSKDSLEKFYCINGAIRIASNGKIGKLIALIKEFQKL
ncbi:hypothetical protein PMAYCL1PPCAC_15837 [Pristionchus mayeri]|uniref:Fatty-acid and retinol-binding protein 1 n=1 Tax=Pristionchus mayeri TaxID=1317129 RepID=A0AAN5HYJ9_9BILA|nr:hypothetical protein PMAYCL1PPCAC_15837 [Pristionchus mayeri]